MRRIALLLVTFFPLFASAQQQCESGIYMQVGLSPSYVSFHVSGSTAIAAHLYITSSGGVTFTYPGYGTARPSQLEMWAYSVGTWDGSTYRFSGTLEHGACLVTGHASCDGSGNATSVIDGMAQTPSGASWGVNCQGMFDYGAANGLTTVQYRKIF